MVFLAGFAILRLFVLRVPYLVSNFLRPMVLKLAHNMLRTCKVKLIFFLSPGKTTAVDVNKCLKQIE